MSHRARDADPPEPASSRAVVLARILVPIALGVVGYAVLISERWEVDHELQLVAPDRVRPGDPIPLRAFVFDGIDDPDGGELVAAQVDVELRDGERVLARTTLDTSRARSSEGALAPPDDATDARLDLVASARDDDGALLATVTRALTIEPDAPPAPLRGRVGLPLQQIDVGPVIAEATGVPLPPLEVRVAGGACVPEERCALWIDAGDADTITIEETPAASVGERSTRDGALVRLVVVPHGPEASVELVASRLGQPLARRTVRLPIALATPWIDAPRVVSSMPIPLEAHPPVGREVLTADLFYEGRWIATATLDPARPELPFDVGPGLYRVEVRADPFGGERAAARYVLVAPAGSDLALHDTRELLRREDVELTDREGTEPRLLLAGAEEEVRTLPSAISGLEDDRRMVAERRRRLHFVAGLALGLGIAVLAMSLLRRGLFAAAEARDVMHEAGDPEARSVRARARTTLAVIAIVGAVAVALLAGAALILARAALVTG
ncbi:hypothetical protein [Sandaracinus amylolyticus]|uniref:Uncharacterized protein n=1 Tax=Sandaracinus amylolyticus TaxID=927083 RepID=A0A0F6W607_9BACT|nr:hypothetical protein [Sandaracinus amylolyticus]AKF08165.1 hypothetical protein DB32_005314 [Sandaracinus amylolyticus]